MLPFLSTIPQAVIELSGAARPIEMMPGRLAVKRVSESFQRHCLALAIYHEARGEDASGQHAVAWVIINRTRSEAYPETVCSVVYQNARWRNRCQFSFACDGRSDYPREKAAWLKARAIAAIVMCGDCGTRAGTPAGVGEFPIHEATHYHADYVAPRWAKRMRRLGRIGRHIFFACEQTLARARGPEVQTVAVTVP